VRARSHRLGPGERRRYAEQGFFVRPEVFADHELAELRDAVERCAELAAAAARSGGERYEIDGNVYHEAGGTTIQFEHHPGATSIRVLEPFHHLDPRIDALIDDPRFAEPARDLCGAERVSLFTDMLNLKRPRQGSRFRWHQVSPYWAHFHPEVGRLPNLMLALDDASEQNGCLRIVPGSHRRGMLPGLQGQGRLGPLFTDPRHFDAAAQQPCAMRAGSLLCFSPHVVHGSEPNRSAQPRRALLFTYQPGVARMFKVDAKREAGGPA
jgi:hypothetical protein